MTNKELIDIAYSMDCDGDYEGYYEFAKDYLSNPSLEQDKKVQSFFNSIKVLMNNAGTRAVQSVLGKRNSKSETAQYEIRRWCKYILNAENLKSLTPDELQYVLGYCARMAKIKKERI